VKHTSSAVNLAMRIALPWLEPTRYDKTLKKFPNYGDLWHSATLPGERVEHRSVTAQFVKSAKLCEMIARTKTSARKQ
jgi:hypothetical protein